jgi:acyl-CoA thioester hydrolase
MREDFSYWYTIQVRWGDMDAHAHVNNAKYFTFFESARVAFFDSVDVRLHSRDQNEGPALVTTTANFKQQVRYPATLEIGVRLTRIGNRSIALAMSAFLEGSGSVVAEATSVNAWVDYDRDESTNIPDALRVVLTPHLNSTA